MGQELHGWPAPTGFPASVLYWGYEHFWRWKFAWELTTGSLNGLGLPFNPNRLFNQLGPNGFNRNHASAQVDRLLCGGYMTPLEKSQIDAYVAANPGLSDPAMMRRVAFLAMSFPTFSRI